jgi:twitching motility protein PilT
MTQTTFLQTLLEQLSQDDVSDLHLSPHTDIWLRRSGDMTRLTDSADLTTPTDINSWLSAIRYQSSTIAELVGSKGGQDDFAANLGDLRVRMHVYISAGEINVAVRKLASQIPPLGTLGLPAGVKKLLDHPTGLVLVVGGTGSGKSTTLASCVDQINSTLQGHIITLEDPIEYLHRDKSCRVRQRQVGPGHDCENFAAGVVAAMREDPDIILVGEVRDQQTMQACLAAAQTGHLVFATLHTNSTTEAVERVLAFYPEKERDLARSVLSSVLRGVIAQRLVKASAGGRVLASELLLCTPAIRANIAGNQLIAIEQSMESGRSEGQITLNYSLQQLFENGLITRETALTASSKRDYLEKRIGVA